MEKFDIKAYIDSELARKSSSDELSKKQAEFIHQKEGLKRLDLRRDSAYDTGEAREPEVIEFDSPEEFDQEKFAVRSLIDISKQYDNYIVDLFRIMNDYTETKEYHKNTIKYIKENLSFDEEDDE